MNRTRSKAIAGAGGLLLAGVAFGGIVAGTLSASAAEDTSTSSPTTTSAPGGQQLDPSKSSHPGEELLTGSTAEKVRAAALAKYPNATIQRVETDSDGVYEAHIVTAAGGQLIVQVGKDFSITGTQSGFGRGDHDGPPPGQPDTSDDT